MSIKLLQCNVLLHNILLQCNVKGIDGIYKVLKLLGGIVGIVDAYIIRYHQQYNSKGEADVKEKLVG